MLLEILLSCSLYIFLSIARLILDVAPNGVVQPLRLVGALIACNEKQRIKFVEKATRDFAEDMGMALRIGLGQLRMLLDTTARGRCLCNVSYSLVLVHFSCNVCVCMYWLQQDKTKSVL